MSKTVIRNYRSEDAAQFVQVQNDCFRQLEYLPRVKVGLGAIERDGSFIAEKDGATVGNIGLFRLDRPGWFEIKNLAAKGPDSGELAKQLLAKAVDHVDSTHPHYVKASTPAIQPFVDYYKKAGFEPKRRSLRIAWDLSSEITGARSVETRELSAEHADLAAEVWVKGLRPYWDYWIEEKGGLKNSQHGLGNPFQSARDGLAHSSTQNSWGSRSSAQTHTDPEKRDSTEPTCFQNSAIAELVSP
jgi:predicted N-acetyltransferase YhbS